MHSSHLFWSTSEQEILGSQHLSYQSSSDIQVSQDFQGEDLEIILPDSEDQDRPSPRSQRRKKKGKRKPTSLSSYSLPAPSSVTMADKVLGKMAPREQLFCPFQAVSKYPYRYIRKSDSETVAKAYFAGGKLRARGWSIYYIHTTISSAKPLLLVPAIEFRALLAEINKNLDLQLKFPDDPGFLLSFLEDGSPRPRYLGCLSDKSPLEVLESQMPEPDSKQEGEDDVDPRSFEAFRLKMKAAIETGKNRSKGSKEKRKKARVMEKKSCCLQLQRAQRYLGMKPVLVDPVTEVFEWRELEEACKRHEEAITKSRQALDTTKPAPYAFHQNVIFVSIDVEWYERSNNTITEIGISTLDTADLLDIPPGKGSLAWMNQIRARHFRIREHSHLINSDFVVGCGDRFEAAFGTSEWISIKEAPQMIASCFRFGAALIPQDLTSEKHQAENSCSSSSASEGGPAVDTQEPKRNIILVGHDVKTDVDHLRGIGFDVSNMSNILEVIDTADMFRALKHEQQPRSLGAILLDLGLTGWNLHNAGNDAAYTLQAMLGIAFKALDVSRERRAAIDAARAIRIEDAAKDAQQHIQEDYDEWDLVDVEHDEAAPVTLNMEQGKPIDLAVVSTEVDGKQWAKEKVDEIKLDGAEAERLAQAAGDDIGDDGPGRLTVETKFPGVKVDLNTHYNDVVAVAVRPTSDVNSQPSSTKVAGSNDMGMSDNDGEVDPNEDDDSSPIATEMAERLKFLDDEEGDEEGGVKV